MNCLLLTPSRTGVAGLTLLLLFSETLRGAEAPPSAWISAIHAALPADQARELPFLAATLSEVFSDSREFTAQVEVSLPGLGPRDIPPLAFATRAGQMRWHLNLERNPTPLIQGDWLTWVRDHGLAHPVVLIQPQGSGAVLFPARQAWFAIPESEFQSVHAQAQDEVGKMRKSRVGEAVWDGHTCTLYRLQSGSPDLAGIEGRLWVANDLKGLPVKLDVRSGPRAYGIQFRQVQLKSGPASWFQAPAAYRKFPDAQAFLESIWKEALAAPALAPKKSGRQLAPAQLNNQTN